MKKRDNLNNEDFSDGIDSKNASKERKLKKATAETQRLRWEHYFALFNLDALRPEHFEGKTQSELNDLRSNELKFRRVQFLVVFGAMIRYDLSRKTDFRDLLDRTSQKIIEIKAHGVIDMIPVTSVMKGSPGTQKNAIKDNSKEGLSENYDFDYYLQFEKIKELALEALEKLKVFLEGQLKMDTQAKKTLITATSPKVNEKLNFGTYLNEKGNPLLSKLTEIYTDGKPKSICFMLLALSELACLTSNLDTANKTQLHLALEKSFGKIGTRQSLSDNLNKLKADFYKVQIDTCKNEIATFLKKS